MSTIEYHKNISKQKRTKNFYNPIIDSTVNSPFRFFLALPYFICLKCCVDYFPP